LLLDGLGTRELLAPGETLGRSSQPPFSSTRLRRGQADRSGSVSAAHRRGRSPRSRHWASRFRTRLPRSRTAAAGQRPRLSSRQFGKVLAAPGRLLHRGEGMLMRGNE
jgi:hypothetical protein